jgi:hypothetical protein
MEFFKIPMAGGNHAPTLPSTFPLHLLNRIYGQQEIQLNPFHLYPTQYLHSRLALLTAPDLPGQTRFVIRF